jgi:hypothetical protein
VCRPGSEDPLFLLSSFFHRYSNPKRGYRRAFLVVFLKFQKLSYGSKTSDMTYEALGEMFLGDSADMCAGQFPLVLSEDPHRR